ncbi:GntR family transcriptional regulator [Skermanella stibiiresistens SB22]|jgi:DNA-binding GntR family transcriptional regulator|uniref:GntR family transcriptional regulator n=2 Tax=Skermanella TaxID=204447 RepID=W9H0V2_9PROT|nr:GntR family transcriptional regulator [Skermanella stibiiresistens SB22]
MRLARQEPRRTRADEIREAIADDIMSGLIFPGVRLDEQELADRFGVSRTPVREALKQLSATGLIMLRAHKGAVVTPMTIGVLSELFEALAELEAGCARLAAEKMTGAERRALEEVHREVGDLVRRGDPDRYHLANIRFHDMIYEGGHNGFLAETTVALRRRLSPFSRAQFRNLGRMARSFAEHDQIVTAIVRGDGDGAFHTMRAHLATVEHAFEDYLAEEGRTAKSRESATVVAAGRR